MSRCHYGLLRIIQIDPIVAPETWESAVRDAVMMASAGSAYGEAFLFFICSPLLIQILFLLNILVKRHVTTKVLIIICITGVIGGPSGFYMIEYTDLLFEKAMHAECRISLSSNYYGISVEYQKNINSIIFLDNFYTILNLYLIGVHTFASAWAVNLIFQRRINYK